MKKNQVRKILSNITMYQQKIMSLGCLIVIMIFLTVSLFLFYENKKDKQYIHFDRYSSAYKGICVPARGYQNGDRKSLCDQ